MSRRRRQERRRGRQPLVASRCTLCPGMARLGSARPGRRRSRREPAAAAPLLHGGVGESSRPASRWSPRRLRALPAALPSHETAPGTDGQRLRVPAAAGHGRGAGVGCCEPDKDSRGRGGGEGGGRGGGGEKGYKIYCERGGRERKKTAPPSLLQQEKPAETRPRQSTAGMVL
ncbi:uncharacterized protein ACIB01_005259 [Guaruba guarouba]